MFANRLLRVCVDVETNELLKTQPAAEPEFVLAEKIILQSILTPDDFIS